MNYNFDWSVVERALPRLIDGLGVTIGLTLIVIAISMILAVPLAMMRMSKIEVVRWPAQGYIEIFRCTPLLVQLFWIFFALPVLTGVTLPGYWSAVIALSANLTAFMAEAYRSGFQAVPVEQIEAGKMLRLTSWEQMRYIILPQALRQQLPVILSLNITMFKDTALVSTIAVADLMFVSRTVATESYRSLEIFTVAALVYFLIAFPVSLIISALERRMQQNATFAPPKKRGRGPGGLLPGTRPAMVSAGAGMPDAGDDVTQGDHPGTAQTERNGR